jgi:UDP-N-acetylmuramoyl-tripeptide--D-alanyl-D-alanine ligase
MNPIEKVYSLIKDGNPISTDSRQVSRNDIFFALKGENFDGNRYAKNALEKGASLAVVDDNALKGEPNMVIVPNTLDFLHELAILHRKSLSIPIIGLTGSNGKTTTKELITAVLQKKYKTFATKGNLNNHIGVPLSILSINQSHEIAIVEMGANHIGEIALLCTIAQPTHGLITNIGKAHLEGFGSFEGVKKAKSEIYKFLFITKGKVFLNQDNPTLVDLVAKYTFSEVVNYGEKVYKVNSDGPEQLSLTFKFENSGQSYEINSQLIGEYNIENILTSICVGQYFKVTLSETIKAIEDYTPTNSRSQLVNTKNNTVILDAYNANPSSMELALKNFSNLPTPLPKMLILGEMLELGDFAKEEHARIALMAKKTFENIIFIGMNFHGLEGSSKWFENQTKCATYLKSEAIRGHAILLKGSRGVKLEGLLKYL